MLKVVSKNKGLNSPYEKTIEYDGWHINYVNESLVEVVPHSESRINLKTKIKFCERYASQRKLSLQFKLFSSRNPEELDKILQQEMYFIDHHQLIMSCNHLDSTLDRRNDVVVKVFDSNQPNFSELRKEMNLDQINQEKKECIVELFYDELMIGSAFATVKDNRMGIFNVFVEPKYRGRGLGEHLMRVIFHWGKSVNVSRAYLNVDSDNSVAIELYRKIGFVLDAKMWIRKKLADF